MKKFIATLIVFVGIFGCASLEEQQREKQTLTETRAWLDMCQLLIDEHVGYECRRLMPPLVHYQSMRDGLHGFYDGSDTIYINSELEDDSLFDVLMHEGIHYVHVQHGIIPLPGPAKAICWSENEAWLLTGRYWKKDHSKWWRAYPHCWEFYANTQEMREYGIVWNWINEIVDGIMEN